MRLAASVPHAHARAVLTQRAFSLPVFTNILKDSFLQELAEADEGELVKQVQVPRPARYDMNTPFFAAVWWD